jgi:hypothetical protein
MAPLAGSLPKCAEAIGLLRTSFDMLRCRTKIQGDMSAILQTPEKFERHDKFQGRKTKKKAVSGGMVYENGLWRRI